MSEFFIKPMVAGMALMLSGTSAGVMAAAADIRASGYVPEGVDRVVRAVPIAPRGGDARNTVVVKRGDTLEKLVKTHLKHLPFRQDILAEALVARNPGAFKGTKSRTPVIGAVLVLPSADDYATVIFGPEARPSPAEEAPEPVDPRRGWVRYP
jgi:hypothetical protein